MGYKAKAYLTAEPARNSPSSRTGGTGPAPAWPAYADAGPLHRRRERLHTSYALQSGYEPLNLILLVSRSM